MQDYRTYEPLQSGLGFKQRTVGSEIRKYVDRKDRKPDAVALCPPHPTYTALGWDLDIRVEYPPIIRDSFLSHLKKKGKCVVLQCSVSVLISIHINFSCRHRPTAEIRYIS